MDKFGMLLVLLSVTVFSVFFSDAYGQNVLTYTPVTVTSSSAVLRGSVSGEAVASEKGFEWKVSSETSGYTKVKSDGSNPMTYKLTGLAPMTTYSFRTYAIYGGQEKYGETYSFTTVSDNFMDGSNLGLMMSEEPNFLGWKARLGAYTTKPNLPPYEITKTFFNFNSTVEDIYGEYDDPSKAVAGFGRHYVEIKTDTNEFDKNSMQKLKTIPTHLGYERSMFFGNTNYGDDATDVYYDFTVRSDMSLVTIVYTIVLQTPHPGEKFINPAFEI